MSSFVLCALTIGAADRIVKPVDENRVVVLKGHIHPNAQRQSDAGPVDPENGISAPLYYVSPGQIDLQVPCETGAGTAVLAINNNGQIATFSFPVAATAPGLFRSAVDNSMGQVVSSAQPGQVLLLFLTGEGDVTPTLATGATPAVNFDPTKYPQPRLPVSVTVGGVPAQVLFSGIPSGLVAETQIDFIVPSNALLGPQQVIVSVGNVSSPPIALEILAATP